jgi:N-acetylglutamate synthase-like GNAT family acetyltransferase
VAHYGPDQMSLRMMVTHPDYWRRGAAHLLVDWGVKLATEKKVAIVMFSSPMGKALYETFGFRELAKVHVHVDGEMERLDDISCMAWEHGWANSSAVDGMSEKSEVTESLEIQS